MAKKPETIFSEKFYQAFNKMFGSNGRIENIQQVGKVGTPDYIGVVGGRFVAFELKVDGGVIAPLQVVKLMEFKKAGGLAYIVYPHTMKIVLDEINRITQASLNE
jgi:hypothetical protein